MRLGFRRLLLLAAGVLVVGVARSAGATTIDFSAEPVGPVSTIGDATFSLAGVGAQGLPAVDNLVGSLRYLWNSPTGNFDPTNTTLRVDFGVPVDGLFFVFDPFGINGNPGQGWSIFDASLSPIASGAFTNGPTTYDLSAYSDIGRLDLNNGGNDWLQGLAKIGFAPVPEPGTLFLVGSGLIGLTRLRRRR